MALLEKRCPRCSAVMVVRTNKASGQEFLGCSRWPECDHTEELPESYRMLREGHEMLPGFGETDG